MNKQLNLVGGFHVGPLFEPTIVKPPRPYRSGGSIIWAKYKLAKPPWVRWGECAAFWDRSLVLTAATGIQYSVDHIVPLVHPMVCGLHAPANLQVKPLSENIRKSNTWWPDMWNEQLDLF